MGDRRTYSDEQLSHVLAASTSWRGTLRGLGLGGTSAGVMRSVRAHADRLGLDYSHFSGRRRWKDSELRDAVAGATTWPEVVERLGLTGGSAVASVKGHAARLGLDVDHLYPAEVSEAQLASVEPDLARLSRAGSLVAAAWFTLCGYDVSWPLEPCRYDLLTLRDGRVCRVQVKTTTLRVSDSWQVFLSTTRRSRTAYTPDEIDDFFIIDGDLNYYLIPIHVVGGLHAIHLRTYRQYLVNESRGPRRGMRMSLPDRATS